MHPLYARFAKVITWIAVTVAILVTISLPSAYLYTAYRDLSSILQTAAVIDAALLSQFITQYPEMWEFQEHRLTATLARRPRLAGEEIRRVLNLQKQVVVEQADPVKPPLITRSVLLHDSGTVAGELQVSASLLPIIPATGVFALWGMLLGLVVFASLRVLPLRVLARTASALDAAQAALDRTNAALQAQHAFVLQVMNAMPHGLGVLDVERKFELVNEAYARMLGHAPADLIGRSVEEVVVSEDLASLQEQFVRRRAGEATSYEIRHRRSDGTLVPTFVSAVPRLDNGKVCGSIGVVMDITERKQAEEALRQSEARYKHLVDRASDIICEASAEGRLVFFNPTAVRLLGYAEADLKDRLFLDLVAPDARKAVETFNARQYAQRIPSTYNEVPVIARDGATLWLGVTVQLVIERDQIAGLHLMAHDITTRKQAEMALEEAKVRLEASVAELEQRNREMQQLREMGELLQSCQTPQEGYGIVADLVPRLFPNLGGALFILKPSRDFAEPVVSWGAVEGEQRLLALDDCWALRRGTAYVVDSPGAHVVCAHVTNQVPARYMCVPLVAAGDTLGMLHVQAPPAEGQAAAEGGWSEAALGRFVTAVAENIALALSNLRLRETLRAQSIRDPLTGLFNRRYMEESTKRELHRATRHGTPVAVVMMDLDHFKRFNDTFGHAAGDVLLREVAGYLQQHVRGEDIACRYGGEEFVLILPGAGPEAITNRLHQLREGIRHLNTQHLGQSLGAVTLSAGVAVYPGHGETVEALLRAADAALYQAKAAGRDRVVVYDSEGFQKHVVS